MPETCNEDLLPVVAASEPCSQDFFLKIKNIKSEQCYHRSGNAQNGEKQRLDLPPRLNAIQRSCVHQIEQHLDNGGNYRQLA